MENENINPNTQSTETASQPDTLSPIEISPPKNNKGLIAFLVILVLVLAGTTAYFAYKSFNKSTANINQPQTITQYQTSPQNTPITKPIITNSPNITLQPSSQPQNSEPEDVYIKEWESYTSERFGFSFKNPGNFFLETTYEDYYPDQGHIHIYQMKYWDLITDPPQEGRGGAPLIEISAYKNSNNLDLIEWATTDTSHSNYSGTHTQTAVDGKEAIRYNWEGMGEGETVLLLDKKTNHIISITMLVTDDLITPYEQILSSFELAE